MLQSFGFEWLVSPSSCFDGVEFFHRNGVSVRLERSSAPLQAYMSSHTDEG